MPNVSISIVTVTYNDLIGLEKTIISLDNLFPNPTTNIEHIIVNGNSTDGTDKYLDNLIKFRALKTLIITEPDLGIYDAMNKGVIHSQSDYIIFINSGDFLLKNFNESEIQSILKHTLTDEGMAGISFGCFYRIFSFSYKIFPRNVNFKMPKMPTLHQGILYKKSILLDIPFTLNYKICGDFENINSIIKTKKFLISNIFISELTAGGISSKKPFLLLNESISIFKKNNSPSFLYLIIYTLRLSISIIFFQFIYFFLNLYYMVKQFLK